MPLEGKEPKEIGPILKALKFSRRHFITVFFPIICFGAIYKDYQRTTMWKIRQSSAGLP